MIDQQKYQDKIQYYESIRKLFQKIGKFFGVDYSGNTLDKALNQSIFTKYSEEEITSQDVEVVSLLLLSDLIDKLSEAIPEANTELKNKIDDYKLELDILKDNVKQISGKKIEVIKETKTQVLDTKPLLELQNKLSKLEARVTTLTNINKSQKDLELKQLEQAVSINKILNEIDNINETIKELNNELSLWKDKRAILVKGGNTSSGSSFGSQINIQFKDEENNLGTPGTVSEIKFVGSGVEATRVGNILTVSIPGLSGTIPTKLSDLTKDINFDERYYTETEVNTITDGLNDSFNQVINDTKADTLAEVDTKLANIVNSAPATLDTLKELADALGDDPNFATTIATQMGNKADKSTTYTKTEIDVKTTDIQSQLDDKADSVAISAVLDLKADKVDTYTKTEVGGFLGDLDNSIQENADALQLQVDNRYTKSEIDAKTNDIQSQLDDKADSVALSAVLDLKADKSDVYTKTEIDIKTLDIIGVEVAGTNIIAGGTFKGSRYIEADCQIIGWNIQANLDGADDKYAYFDILVNGTSITNGVYPELIGSPHNSSNDVSTWVTDTLSAGDRVDFILIDIGGSITRMNLSIIIQK